MKRNEAIVVFDENMDVIVFPSLEFATRWLEFMDVDDGVYGEFAYTAQGHELRLSTEEEVVSIIPTGRKSFDEFRSKLSRVDAELAEASCATVENFILSRLKR
nr:hypothetical protein [uncultured Actinotalea sp.]